MDYAEMVTNLKTLFPGLATGPAKSIFEDEAVVNAETILKALVIMDMVVQKKRGGNPFRKDMMAYMEANDWFSSATDEDVKQADSAVKMLFALSKAG